MILNLEFFFYLDLDFGLELKLEVDLDLGLELYLDLDFYLNSRASNLFLNSVVLILIVLELECLNS